MTTPLGRVIMRAQPDERLVALARKGHEAAYDEIDRRYRSSLVAFAYAYEPASAEDIVQESLSRTWTALSDQEREIDLKPWLYTLVRNRALNARRDRRDHDLIDDTIDGVRQPQDIVLAREELDRVVAAVAALPEGQREALIKSALDGRTHEQIATELGASPGSVRGLIHRGRVTVRTTLGSAVPLPVIALLTEGGAAAGGTVVASGALTKVAAVATVGVVAVGSGLAMRDRGPDEPRGGPAIAKAQEGKGEKGRKKALVPGDTEPASNSSRRGPGQGPPGDEDDRDDRSGRDPDDDAPDDESDDDEFDDDTRATPPTPPTPPTPASSSGSGGSSGSGSSDDYDEPATAEPPTVDTIDTVDAESRDSDED